MIPDAAPTNAPIVSVSSPRLIAPIIDALKLAKEVGLDHKISSIMETVLFKVGDGSKVFNELQWASARAADVYNWAKQSTLPIEKLGSGNVVASISWDSENNKLKYETVSAATSEDLKALQDLVASINTRLSTAETAINNISNRVTTLEDANLDTRVKAIEDDYLKSSDTYILDCGNY